MFINVEVDAHEGRYVATFDILVEYLHTKVYRNVIVLPEGSLAELVVKVSPKLYQKYGIVGSKVKPLL